MKTLRFGDTGVYVSYAKLALMRSGFYKSAINEVFGNDMLGSVLNFQRDFGLVPDGIVGENTWSDLLPFLRGYYEYTVRNGDSFFELARKFSTSLRAIQAANPNSNADNLEIGATIIIPYGFSLVPTNVRYSSFLTLLIYDGLIKRYPFIGHGVYGKSVMGNDLVYMSIGSGTKKAGYNASHHANEWITTPLLLKYIEEYASAYANFESIYGISARSLYSSKTLFVMPLVNPDGVDLVTGALNSGPYFEGAVRISEDYPQIPFPSGWKANIQGTDPNLNYPADWEEAREIKYSLGFTSPAPTDYVGTAPLSIPESKSLYDLTLRENFNLTISYHTQGGEIYWKYKNIEPPRGYEIGRQMSYASGYTLTDPAPQSSNAGYKDWFILNYNRPGYTVEAGRGVNPLPISDFTGIYNNNIGAMTLALNLI